MMRRHTVRTSTLSDARYTLMWRALVVFAMVLALVQPVTAQGDISFVASVDRTTLSLGETVNLDLVLQGTFQNSARPDLPPFEGLSVVSNSQSSQFSMVNGVITSKVVYRYRLQAMREGEITIPIISIRVGGQTYHTDPIALQVGPSTAQPSGQPTALAQPSGQGQGPTGIEGQGVFIEATVDNPSPVVGEQITYSFWFYQAIRLYSQPKLDWPEFNGFLSYDLTPNLQTTRIVAGRQYQVTEVRKALFATVAGQVTIPPAVLTIPGDFVNQTVTLETQPVVIEAQRLPEGAPDGFGGAVGQFEIDAWANPAETRVNEPINLHVRIAGTGNIAAVTDPFTNMEASLTDWRAYAPKTTTDERQIENRIAGTKQFERPMVPEVPGRLEFPPISITYFDPQDGAYHTIETDPVPVQVAESDAVDSAPIVISGGKQNVVVLASDIRHIKAAPASVATRRKPLTARTLYWFGWIVPLTALGSTWAWDRRRRHLNDNVALARSLRAARDARRRIEQARRTMSGDEDISHIEDAVYAAVAAALTRYLADKFDLPAAGITRDMVRQQLATHDVSEETTTHVLDLLDWADLGRFAPTADGRSASDLIAAAETCVATLESLLS